jgi:hypothetical protein
MLMKKRNSYACVINQVKYLARNCWTAKYELEIHVATYHNKKART